MKDLNPTEVHPTIDDAPEKKPLGPVHRPSVIVIASGNGILEVWSNLKIACKYYGWSYHTLTKRQLPTRMKERGFPGRIRTVYRLKINYARTINEGENV